MSNTNTNHLKENNVNSLSALNPQQDLKSYPHFILKLQRTKIFKFLKSLRNFYRKIRFIVNFLNIIFCMTLSISFLIKLLDYKNYIKPIGFTFKKISVSFVKPDLFVLDFKVLPLTQNNQTLKILNTSIQIEPLNTNSCLNTNNCWYKFTSDFITKISTNTKETEISFEAKINPKHSLSKIYNEIKTKGYKIILQSTIYVTKFLIFKSTYFLKKEYTFKHKSLNSTKNSISTEMFYILNRILKGKRVLFSEIKEEQLDILDFSIPSNRENFLNVVTPNICFENLKTLSFDLPNLEFFYKTNTSKEIKRVVLNDFKMIDGKLLPFKLIADDLSINTYSLNTYSIEYLYLKLFQTKIKLLYVSISGYSIFDYTTFEDIFKKNFEEEDLKEVIKLDFKEISPEKIYFSLSFLKTYQPEFPHQKIPKDTGILKIMSLDEHPLLLFKINYTFQTKNNLKNKRIEIEIKNIDWQLTLKGLKNGEEVQIIDYFGQHVSNFSLKTFSPINPTHKMNQEKEDKRNEYNLNSWVQNITTNSFEISCLLNILIKNKELIKKGIQINFLKNTEIKLSNEQLNLYFFIKKQTLIKPINSKTLNIESKTLNKYFEFQIFIFPKKDFVGFTKLKNLFIFKLENNQQIDLQDLSPRILNTKDVIGMFNHLSINYSENNIIVNLKETSNLNESLRGLGFIDFILYFPLNYEIFIFQKIIPHAVGIKSPERLHICFTANKILFKSFRLFISLIPINLIPFVSKNQSDALRDILFIFLNTYFYELSINNLYELSINNLYELSNSINNKEILINNKEIKINEERQDLLKKLSEILKNYTQIKNKVKYESKPKIHIKLTEKEINSVFEIKINFSNNSNINSLLKEIKEEIYTLNSHKYFSKSFSENLQEKVYKKFMKQLLLLNNFPLDLNLNIKSIEINSLKGLPILKLFIPNSYFDQFEINELELSIEVYFNNIYAFLEDNFLFEIFITNSENKKIKIIKSKTSENIFINLLGFIKSNSKNSIFPDNNLKNNSIFNLLNRLPFFNLLNIEYEIYVELLYENIFKLTLSNQGLKELEIKNHNLDLSIERFLSELVFYFRDLLSNRFSKFFTYFLNYGLEGLGVNSFWNLLNEISNIEITEEKYTKHQSIEIHQSFREFKTEIIYTINDKINKNFKINYTQSDKKLETIKFFNFVYKNTILSFSLNFDKNILKNISLKFTVSEIFLENSKFNDKTYIFKRLISFYRKLFIKFKGDKNFAEIKLNFGQILKFYDSYKQYVIKLGFQKVKGYATEKLNNLKNSLRNWFMNSFS